MKIKATKGRICKLLTISINPERYVQFEIGKRGLLFWVVTENTVRVVGYGRKPAFNQKIVFNKWVNDHCCCG